jgi:hypothetical protein
MFILLLNAETSGSSLFVVTQAPAQHAEPQRLRGLVPRLSPGGHYGSHPCLYPLPPAELTELVTWAYVRPFPPFL